MLWVLISAIHSSTPVCKFTHNLRVQVYALVTILTFREELTFFTRMEILAFPCWLVTIREVATTDLLLRRLINYFLTIYRWTTLLFLLWTLLTTIISLVLIGVSWVNRSEFLETLFFKLLCLVFWDYWLFKVEFLGWLWSKLVVSVWKLLWVLVSLFYLNLTVLTELVPSYQLIKIAVEFIVSTLAKRTWFIKFILLASLPRLRNIKLLLISVFVVTLLLIAKTTTVVCELFISLKLLMALKVVIPVLESFNEVISRGCVTLRTFWLKFSLELLSFKSNGGCEHLK